MNTKSTIVGMLTCLGTALLLADEVPPKADRTPTSERPPVTLREVLIGACEQARAVGTNRAAFKPLTDQEIEAVLANIQKGLTNTATAKVEKPVTDGTVHSVAPGAPLKEAKPGQQQPALAVGPKGSAPATGPAGKEADGGPAWKGIESEPSPLLTSNNAPETQRLLEQIRELERRLKELEAQVQARLAREANPGGEPGNRTR